MTKLKSDLDEIKKHLKYYNTTIPISIAISKLIHDSTQKQQEEAIRLK